MKRTLILSMLFAGFLATAQTTITYQNHSYKENANYVYQIVEFANPGEGGENQIWDFSKLSSLDKMDGEMNVEKYALRNDYFPSGNIAVMEFGNQFIFETNDKEMVQLGFISKNENTVITYLKPMLKLKFPMNYSDQFSGDVELKYEKSGTVKTGNYTVTADAYGTVVLPNKTSLNNALRVKSVTHYKLKNGSQQTQVAHRWYVQQERFPVMVLQQTIITTANGKMSTSQKAAYNSLTQNSASLTSAENFSIYPNPVQTSFDIKFSNPEMGHVDISIFTIDGKLVDHIHSGLLPEGNQKINHLINVEQLTPGTYVVKINSVQEKISQLIIIQQ